MPQTVSHLNLADSLDSLPLGVFVLRRDYVVLLWNRCLEQWTGLTSQEMVGQDIRQRFPHLGQGSFAGRLELVFQTGAPTIFSSQLHHYVIPVARPGSGHRHQHTIVSSVPDQEGGGFHALFAIQDVTDLSELALLHRRARDQALAEVAARKQTEEALSRSHQLLNSTLDALSNHIAILDQEGNILAVNEAWKKFGRANGLSVPDYGVGCNYLEVCRGARGAWSDEAHLVVEGMLEVLAGRRPDFYLEYPCHAPGQERWFALRVTGFGLGDQMRLVMSHENISHRRKSEKDFLESEERYRVAIEACTDGVMLMREDRVLYANAHMAGMLGFQSPLELIGRDITDFVHPKYKPAVHEYSLRREAGLESPTHFELIALRQNGERFPVEISAALTIFQGQPVTLGYVRDISERRSSEQELRKLSQAVEQSLASVVITDQHGKIEYVNDKFCQVTGYSRQEALGQNPRILKSGLMDPAVYTEMWRSLTTSGQWRGELLNRKKGGDTFWEHAAISAIKKANGQITHYVAVKEDISDRKRAEGALMESNRRLEQTTQLANEMAAQAQAASQAKSAFLASMSHEIRTPLNGVIGMTGLLLDTELSEEQRQFADIVRSSAEALLTLINDILDLSKIEAGRMELELVPFEPYRLVEDVLDIASAPAYAKGLDLWSLFEADLPPAVLGDPSRFRQVLFNLVGNAVKFTERGEVGVRASLERRQGGRAWVRFEVRDTGIGISEQVLGRLFKPFSQADASATRRFGGTGLGLSISKRLVEMMGGSIGVESQPDLGSTFWFVLPWEEAPAPAQPGQEELSPLAGTRVFCVEKNAGTRASLATTLTGWGLVCDEVSGGHEALRCLCAQRDGCLPHQLVIIDLQLPDMEGLTLARALRQDPLFKDLPLVALSTLIQATQDQGEVKECFDLVLNKPIRRDSLRRSLLALLHPEAMGQEHQHGMTGARQDSGVWRGRVLLAEDNPVNQQLAAHLLGRLDLRVDVAGNGREAVDMAARYTYDLIMMDAQMPEMDGLAATREIRRLPGRAGKVPIVAMTAYALAGDRERCLAAGMDDYLSKPINPAELASVVGRLLRLDAPASEVPAPASRGSAAMPVFDRPDLLARVEGDVEIMRDLLGVFVEQSPERLEPLRQAVAAQDLPLVAREAHSLKGELGNLSAKAAAEQARLLDQMAKSGQVQAVREAWLGLQEQYELFLDTLRQEGLVG